MSVERRYNPFYFDAMNTITALAVACWLEKLSSAETETGDLNKPAQANAFFDGLLALGSAFVLEPLKKQIHTQFADALKQAIEDPKTELEQLTELLLNNMMMKTVGLISSKMRKSPFPYSATTGGFGSGIETLLMTDLLERLYGEQRYPGFKAASTMAKLEFFSFGGQAILGIGVLSNTLRNELDKEDREFGAVELDEEKSMNGLNRDLVEDWGYEPSLDNAGCVGMYPPSKAFREKNANKCSTIPTQSAIAQLRPYIVAANSNMIKWAKQKGGTKALEGVISPVDLGVLNGTHPNLPIHPDTGEHPKSLID